MQNRRASFLRAVSIIAPFSAEARGDWVCNVAGWEREARVRRGVRRSHGQNLISSATSPPSRPGPPATVLATRQTLQHTAPHCSVYHTPCAHPCHPAILHPRTKTMPLSRPSCFAAGLERSWPEPARRGIEPHRPEHSTVPDSQSLPCGMDTVCNRQMPPQATRAMRVP